MKHGNKKMMYGGSKKKMMMYGGKKKMMKDGGKLKMVMKDGKKVPFFAADGKGKMQMGGVPAKLKAKFDRGDEPAKGKSKRELRQEARKKKKVEKRITKAVKKISKVGPAKMQEGGLADVSIKDVRKAKRTRRRGEAWKETMLKEQELLKELKTKLKELVIKQTEKWMLLKESY